MAALAAQGAGITVQPTTRRGDAEAFARAGAGGGFDRIVAAGGDGTINEAINGLAGSGTALAIVPLGKKSESSLPRSSQTRSRNRLTVGSSIFCSSPTSASSMAFRMPGEGLVLVSL